MANTQKTVIVTGGSQGIGAGLVKAFLDRGYSVVANSRNISKSGAFAARDELALVDGSITEAATAAKITEVAKSKFRSIDALVNNAGIYFSKQFTDYTIDDLRSLVSVNIEGFFFISQLVIKQMLAQKTRETGHTRERRRARRCRYAYAQGSPEGCSQDAATDRTDCRCERHRRRDCLSD